jgi:hypothetical protein
MPANAKPRRRYRPKPVIKPLNMRQAWDIEGEAHMALVALESGEVADEHMAMLAAHADMTRRLAGVDAAVVRQAETILRMVAAVKDRSELRVLAGEEVAIRAAMQVTLPAIRAAGNAEIYRVSRAALRDMERFGGVRVGLNV